MAYGEGPVATYGARNAPIVTAGRPPVVYPLTTQSHAERAARRSRSDFREIDCVRDRLPLKIIAAVEQRDAQWNTPVDERAWVAYRRARTTASEDSATYWSA